MEKIDELTRAEMRHKFRQMYWDLKLSGCLQVVYELIESASILCEVITEECGKENKD